MIAFAPQVRVFVCREPVDMRKSFDGLAALVESALEQDPLSGGLFVFFNRRRDRIKILYWGLVGYCIWYQQLQQGTYQLPSWEHAEGQAAREVTLSQLSLILDGIDLSSVRQRPRFQLAK